MTELTEQERQDQALELLLDRYTPGSMFDSTGTAELVAQCRRLRAERDMATEDATFLSECAASLQYDSDGLIEEITEAAFDAMRRELRRRFDPLRLTAVTTRYADSGGDLSFPKLSPSRAAGADTDE